MVFFLLKKIAKREATIFEKTVLFFSESPPFLQIAQITYETHYSKMDSRHLFYA